MTDPFLFSMWSSHWTHREFTFKSDKQDYLTKLSDDEKRVVRRALLLISQVEIAVKKYWSNIDKIFPKPEIGEVGGEFAAREIIHSRAYSQVLTVLGLEDKFKEILQVPQIKNRLKYLSKYNDRAFKDDKKSAIYSLILYSMFTENVSLFSQFYIVLGFNRFDNIMKDIANVIAYSFLEEDLHGQFGMTLVNQVRKEFPDFFDEVLVEKVNEEVLEALKAEDAILEWMVGDFENEYISLDIMKSYVRKRIKDSLETIGFDSSFISYGEKEYSKTLWFNEELLVPPITDFFTKKPTQYAKKNKSFNEEDLF